MGVKLDTTLLKWKKKKKKSEHQIETATEAHASPLTHEVQGKVCTLDFKCTADKVQGQKRRASSTQLKTQRKVSQ